MKHSALFVTALLALLSPSASAQSAVPTTAPTVRPQVPYEPAGKTLRVEGRDTGQPDERFFRAHARFLERIKQGPIGLLFVGDSITAGWTQNKELFAKTFGQYEPANFAISGDRTQHVLWRLQNGELDIAPPPKVIVLMIGANNVRSDSPADIARGVDAIVKLMRRKQPATKVLLLGTLPIGADPADPNVVVTREKVVKINEILKTFAEEPNVVFHDMGRKFLRDDGKSSDAMRPDGVHLEPRGYEIWAETIAPVLTEMMK